MYAPDGTLGGEEGWFVSKINGTQADNFSLLHGGAVVLRRHTARGARYRLYLPQTGRTTRLTVKLEPNRELREILSSGDGNYILTLTSSNDFPPTPAGRIFRTLSRVKLLPAGFVRRYIESGRIELTDRDGKVCVSLSGRFAPGTGTTCFAAGRQRYIPLKMALSPDGRQLVILGQRPGSNRQEFLHYTW